MRASLADAILKAYDEIKHNIPEDAPDSTACPLLVQFTLGDVVVEAEQCAWDGQEWRRKNNGAWRK